LKPTRLGTASFVACATVAAMALAQWAGMPVPTEIVVGSALAAVPLAALSATRTVAQVWRGPAIMEFPCDDAALCGPEDAEAIRGAAQLRGTMGGAGNIHRERLVFPALAWWAAAALCAARADPAFAALATWMLLIFVTAVAAAVVFPVRPFYYREVSGGGVAVYPQTTPMLLRALRSDAESAAASEKGLRADAQPSDPG